MIERDTFFRPGGTLPPGSESYVFRRADDDIVDALIAGEFVFVLDSRQKGKSSLIARSLERLHQHCVTTIRIDLQRLGSNLQPEQWYAGLLHSIGQELGLTSALFEYWKRNIEIGPMARWFAALEHAVLPAIQGPIVIFVDEVDYVQSLPFSADEFFAGIRECYNRRSASPEFSRLTFCLAGVASPSQLIQNEDVTPFNIGRRVELTDFTRAEIEPYASQLSSSGRDGRRILDRIYAWVGGHPYLTQLLASKAAADESVRSPRDVDSLVHRALLSEDARQREPNIADVERRLLEASLPNVSADESRSRVLDLYRLILRGDVTSANRDAQIVSTVLLSGIATEESGKLRVRNRLYRTMFDRRWYRNNLPDAEAQRQKAASARAARRVGGISLCVLSVVTILLARLLAIAYDRDRALSESRRLNVELGTTGYETSIALASDRMKDGNYLKAFGLIHGQRTSPDRDWEWRYLDAKFGGLQTLLPASPAVRHLVSGTTAWMEQDALVEVNGQEVSQDGRLIGTVPRDAEPWLLATRNKWPLRDRLKAARAIFSSNRSQAGDDPQPDGESASMISACDDAHLEVEANLNAPSFDVAARATGRREHVNCEFVPYRCYVSHRGGLVIIASRSGQMSLYDLDRRVWVWRTMGDTPRNLWFSPDDRLVMLNGAGPEGLIIRTSDGSVCSRLIGHTSSISGSDWFSDSKRIITTSYDGTVRLWNVSDGAQLRMFLEGRSAITSVLLSSVEKSVIALTQEGALVELSLDTRPSEQALTLHTGEIQSCQISPDGTRCATSAHDGSSVLLDVPSAKPIARYELGVPVGSHPMAFSPDGRLLVLVSISGEAMFVNPTDGRIMRRLPLEGKHPVTVTIARTGRIAFALAEGGFVTLDSWNAAPFFLPSPGFACSQICFSPDGRHVAVGSIFGWIAVLNPITMRTERSLRKPDSKSRVTHVEYSRDGRWLAASSWNGNVYLFAVDGSGRQRVLTGHFSRVWGAAFSPDGTQIVTNSFDNTARVWDVDSGALVSVLQHGSWVSSAAWSPDSRRVVTACADNFVRIFDPKNGFELLKLSGHTDVAFDAKFTPDGKTLISVSKDHTLRLWRSE